ncbi:uncharacterized protein LOC141692047 [Apium graveolens]|uniref:uncharacterized protein LOC141692047 n=1 Tax=Apium graveolens TaxID=4045 RepID=UPI003D7AFBA5
MCGKIVEEAWELSRDKPLTEKISFTAVMLGKWGKEVSSCFRNKIQCCKKIMQRTKGRNAKKLMELYNEQEVFWRQRCKQLWLREGDCNCKFFHAATKVRRKINKIDNLKDDNGIEVGRGTGMEETMISYFSNLFAVTDTEFTSVINTVDSRVSSIQN